MPEQQRKPNFIQRFLYGPTGQKASPQVQPYDEYDSTYNQQSNYSSPLTPMHALGTYGGNIDYTVASGDIPSASVVMVCINWLMRNFPKSQPRVVLPTEDGLEPVVGHSLTRLLKRPNPYYSGTRLWEGTVLSYYWSGKAYWRLVRNGEDVGSQIIQMYYEPHWTCRPVRDNADEFISHYQVWRNREWKDIPREDIVAFDFGFSPHQQMCGMGPLDSVLREVYSDNEAARMTASILRNWGIFSVLFSPTDGDFSLTPTEMARLIAEYQYASTGDNRGMAIASNKPVNMQKGEVDLSKMNLRENRKIFEERVSAALGLSAQVVGLGAGLDRNILGSPEEALRWTYDNNIIPTQNSMAETLDIQLLSQMSAIEAETIEFDQSGISVLKGDRQKEEASAALLWNSNAITLAQLKVKLGLKPATDGSEDVYKWEFVQTPTSSPALVNPLEPAEPIEKSLLAIIGLNGHGSGGH